MRLTPALYYEKQNIQALAVMIKLKEAIKNKDNCRFALGVKFYIVIVVFGRKKKLFDSSAFSCISGGKRNSVAAY